MAVAWIYSCVRFLDAEVSRVLWHLEYSSYSRLPADQKVPCQLGGGASDRPPLTCVYIVSNVIYEAYLRMLMCHVSGTTVVLYY